MSALTKMNKIYTVSRDVYMDERRILSISFHGSYYLLIHVVTQSNTNLELIRDREDESSFDLRKWYYEKLRRGNRLIERMVREGGGEIGS